LSEIQNAGPSVDEQREIVPRIESAFAWTDRLATEATSARRLIDHLDQAILSKAFRGGLVSQDHNDEPASVLLVGFQSGQIDKGYRDHEADVRMASRALPLIQGLYRASCIRVVPSKNRVRRTSLSYPPHEDETLSPYCRYTAPRRGSAVLTTLMLLVHVPHVHALEANAVITGRAEVIDGDTLDIGTTRIRLFGIDAPESAQRCRTARGGQWDCGRAARRALESLAAGQTVTCRGKGLDEFGRLLAVCSTPRAELNATLVRQGLAWAFVRYSDTYVAVEQEARGAKRGVFVAETEPPWEFRAHRWEGATRTAEADRQRRCPIKGNISRSGERIYHLPWQNTYGRVAINENAGERWFCDEGEAERAGWRRAR
jgi:endonuclease YncB( thermonuclease family)